MGSKKVDQATVIILDIGRNVSTPENKNEKSFFESAVECTGRIIERKILSQEKNYLGIILLGSKKAKNNMAEQCPGSFKHIETFAELQTPTWQLISDLPKSPSKSEGDWFDSLIVAADLLKNGVSGVKFMSKKIILMTNFQSKSYLDSENFKTVLNGFKEEQFEVDVFGNDIYEEGNKDQDIELVRQLVQSTGGVSVTLDYCMKFLLFHKRKAINCIPWNVDLSFTPNVKIPVSCYVKLKDEAIIKNWRKAIKNPDTNKASSSEAIVKNKYLLNAEDQSVVESNQVIKGHHYGQEIIPFSEHDKTMLYQPGEKSLKVYGFTNASNLNWHNLNGDGLLYVLGRKGDKKAQQAIRCLVECLQEQNIVGIVRRVFNNGNAPKMFSLMPVIDSNGLVCLSMASICFKEDIKNMAFPPTNLKKYTCTDEQVDAFKDLIKAMDLTQAYEESEFDDTEAFPIAETVSPTAQYVLDCIAFRAMNPDKPLPQPRDDIMMLFKVPPLVLKRSQASLEKLKKVLVLRKVEEEKRYRKSLLVSDAQVIPQSNLQPQDVEMSVPKVNIDSYIPQEITKIETADPINDFKTLISNGKSLGDLSSQMTEAIECILYSNIDGTYSKAFECMLFFRKECVESDPSYYNNWLKKFKIELLYQKKNNIIDLIASKKADLILKSENSSSTIERESQGYSQMYENDTEPMLTDISVSSQIKNLFDDL